MSQDSLNKRYFSRVFSSLITLILSFATISLVPRALGPLVYGSFNFLTTFFNTSLKFLKFGITTAFYSKLSNRQGEKKLIGAYALYILLIVTILLLFTVSSIKLGFQEVIWPDQKINIIYGALIFCLLTLILEFNQITIDALGYTFSFEKINISRITFFTTLVVVFYHFNILTIFTYFSIYYITLLFIIVASWYILAKNNVNLIKSILITKNELFYYMKEFYTYSHPLFISGLVVFIVAILDRWFLQVFSGSEEQGYYSLGFKFGSVFFMFTASITSLLMREMSASYKSKDKKVIKYYVKYYLPVFFFLTAFFGVFISFNSEKIILLIVGDQYINASTVTSILAFYPIHQTYGQLGGAVLQATEKTKVIRNISVSTGIIGIVVAFLFIAPSEFNGLGLGAIGLSMKVVIIQFINVNILLFVIIRFLELSYRIFLFNQILIIANFILIAVVSKYLALLFITNQLIINILLSGFLYTTLTLFSILFYPRIIMLERKELINKFKSLYSNLIDKKLRR